MGQRRSSKRAGYWQGVIGKQESSGMSAAAFCRQHEVPESSFYNWKRKLKQRRREDDSTRTGKATSPGITRSGATRKNSALTFVPLELPTPPAVRPASSEVVLPDGCRIIVPGQCDAHWLREILQVLKERRHAELLASDSRVFVPRTGRYATELSRLVPAHRVGIEARSCIRALVRLYQSPRRSSKNCWAGTGKAFGFGTSVFNRASLKSQLRSRIECRSRST